MAATDHVDPDIAVDQESDLVRYSVTDQIATVTLMRPEKLNAFNDTMVLQLAKALRQFDVDTEANVAIIVGSGRAFSSGADVGQRHLRSREEFEALGGRAGGWGADIHELLTKTANWKPVIAAPHGYAMGAALGLCLSCEFVVAESGTKFQVTEVLRGISGARYHALLTFRGGASLANDVAMTGRFFSAEEAHAAGVIDRIAPAGKFMDVAMDLANTLKSVPPLGVRATVRMRRWWMQRLNQEVDFYVRPLKLTLTEDFAEATRAFVEKRPPGTFKGR